MRIADPTADLPRRELERVALSHGKRVLVITVRVQAGVRKDGEVKYRRLTTTYAVERGQGCVRLVTDRVDEAGENVVYTVTGFGCDCKDADVRGRERTCKHYAAVEAVGLLGAGVLQ